jgi:hypothetical protein
VAKALGCLLAATLAALLAFVLTGVIVTGIFAVGRHTGSNSASSDAALGIMTIFFGVPAALAAFCAMAASGADQEDVMEQLLKLMS